MHKTQIDEFYTLVDNNKRSYVGDFSSIEELINFGRIYTQHHYNAGFYDMITFTKKCIDIKLHVYTKAYNLYYIWSNRTYKNLYVIDSLGKLVDITPKKPRYYYHNYDNQHRDLNEEITQSIRLNLVVKNDNKDKIKSSHNQRRSKWCRDVYYTHDISYFRHPKTMSERRLVNNVLKDENEPEFRGRRKNLPSSYDDISCGAFYGYKSWKHNSKRRKQWKVKSST